MGAAGGCVLLVVVLCVVSVWVGVWGLLVVGLCGARGTFSVDVRVLGGLILGNGASGTHGGSGESGVVGEGCLAGLSTSGSLEAASALM